LTLRDAARVAALRDRPGEASFDDAALAALAPRPADVPLYSTTTGEWLADGALMDADHRRRNQRQEPLVEQAVTGLLAAGHGLFVEVGPHAALGDALRNAIGADGRPAVVLGSPRGAEGGAHRLMAAIADAHVHGVELDWTALFPGARATVDLPTYAFQHEHFWLVDGRTPGGAAQPATDDTDARFWEAVEREDLERLAAELEVAQDAAADLGAVLPVLSSWRRQRRERSTVDAWRYRVTWKPLTGGLPGPALTGRWLVVVPERAAAHPWAAGVTDALARAGAEALELHVSAGELTPQSLAARLREHARDGVEPAGVVSLLALDETPLADHPAVPAGLAGTVALVRALADAGGEARLWAVSRGAVSTGRSDRLTSTVQAEVWGLGRVVALEHPELWGGLVDLPETVDARAAARLATALAGISATDGDAGVEDQLAVRGPGVFARRLAHAPLDTRRR
ncbi:acyltransferase domain-containing protein, partial [Streptomyces spectabilis]|uniref:acyltransferase domain-containing protein n=1 Tax=Streptomyces spectabilis TaxID=68270 RepID=UPI0033E6C503